MNSNKKKILYIITKSNMGGAQRYVFDLATNLSKKRFEPVVAAGGNGPLIDHLKKEGIRTIVIPSLGRDINFRSDIKAFFALCRLCKAERPDVLHLNSSKAGFLGALAGRLYHVPCIIFTAHNWAFNEERGQISKLFLKTLHYFTVLLSTKTIVVSDTTAEQMRLPFIKNKIEVIHNGIRSTHFIKRETARAALMAKQNIPSPPAAAPHAIWVGTIAELHKNKGIEYLLRAASLIKKKKIFDPPLNIIVIGGGEEKERLLELARTLDIEKETYFLGYVDDASSYLKAFDIFALTSITEAFPYAVLEAGSAGVPTIASAVGGIPEIIDDMESGILTKPRSVKDIAEAIQFLLSNREKQILMGNTLKRKILQKFTIPSMLVNTVSIYIRNL